jgi:hypothetical protein
MFVMLWIHVSNTHSHSFKSSNAFSCNLKAALHFADDIGFTFIKAFIAADGPENSVPAIGVLR